MMKKVFKRIIVISLCVLVLIASSVAVYAQYIESEYGIDVNESELSLEEIRNLIDYARKNKKGLDIDINNFNEEQLVEFFDYSKKTGHPYKDFEKYKEDFLAVVNIILRNSADFKKPDKNAILTYCKPDDTRIEYLENNKPWEITDEEKQSIRNIEIMGDGWEGIYAYADHIEFETIGAEYVIAYSINGEIPVIDNGIEYMEPIELADDWYLFIMAIEK